MLGNLNVKKQDSYLTASGQDDMYQVTLPESLKEE